MTETTAEGQLPGSTGHALTTIDDGTKTHCTVLFVAMNKDGDRRRTKNTTDMSDAFFAIEMVAIVILIHGEGEKWVENRFDLDLAHIDSLLSRVITSNPAPPKAANATAQPSKVPVDHGPNFAYRTSVPHATGILSLYFCN
uniref:Uncharacterized protein n=1 Tax=Panagrellus redivivus TaxID=6233 RepID=A0A7E4UVK8_PANRE